MKGTIQKRAVENGSREIFLVIIADAVFTAFFYVTGKTMMPIVPPVVRKNLVRRNALVLVRDGKFCCSVGSGRFAVVRNLSPPSHDS